MQVQLSPNNVGGEDLEEDDDEDQADRLEEIEEAGLGEANGEDEEQEETQDEVEEDEGEQEEHEQDEEPAEISAAAPEEEKEELIPTAFRSRLRCPPSSAPRSAPAQAWDKETPEAREERAGSCRTRARHTELSCRDARLCGSRRQDGGGSNPHGHGREYQGQVDGKHLEG